MGRYKLELYNGISESEIKKISKYIKILDSNDLLEVYIHDSCAQVDMLKEYVFKNEFGYIVDKDIEKSNEVVKYIKLIKKQ